MAATPSVLVQYTVPHRAGTATVSNRYHFTNGSPADQTKWHALMDAVVDSFKATQTAAVTITEVLGYDAGSDVAVSSKAYSTVGTYAPSAALPAPSNCCGLIRWSTAARSSKNHPVYLFSYIRHATIADSGNTELLKSDYKTALETYATAWVSGFSDGSVTHVRAGPNGASATGSFVDQYVRHRDFPS
jgi:hypothetical protein